MKFRYFTLALLFLNIYYFQSQTSLLKETESTIVMALKGDDIYIFQQTYPRTYIVNTRLTKLNLESTISNLTDILPWSEYDKIESLITSAVINEGFLYFTVHDDFQKICRIDITSDSPVVVDILDVDYDFFHGLAISENYLYFSERESRKICKIDLTSESFEIIDVVYLVNKQPRQILINKEKLYFTVENSFYDYDIYELDLSKKPLFTQNSIKIVSGLNRISGIAIKEDVLYIAEINDHKITKITLNGLFPSATNDVVDISSPTGLAIKGDYLYFSNHSGIYKHNISNTLSTENLPSLKNTIKVSPNPVYNVITITGLSNEKNYTVFNVLGMKIQSGNISNNETINVGKINKGIYYIKFDNKNTIKFIKE